MEFYRCRDCHRLFVVIEGIGRFCWVSPTSNPSQFSCPGCELFVEPMTVEEKYLASV